MLTPKFYSASPINNLFLDAAFISLCSILYIVEPVTYGEYYCILIIDFKPQEEKRNFQSPYRFCPCEKIQI